METANKIAVFDIDGTFFRWQLYHELIFALKDNGAFSNEISKKLDTAIFNWRALNATWDDYEMTVVSVAENELKNVSQKELIEIAQETVAKQGHKVYSYPLRLSKKLKKDGYFLLAISGSQQEIVEIFANKYGFDDCIGMIQKINQKGNYTNEYERPIFGYKGNLLKEYVNNKPELSLKDSVAIGDSGGDVDVLELVDNPIAFNPNDSLLQKALDKKWPIVIERKNIAYTLNKDGDHYKLVDYELY